MDDGETENGVGCLFNWNTVVTCAHVLEQPNRRAVEVSFTMFVKDSSVTIRGVRWRVPESYQPGAQDIGVVIIEDPQAFLKYGRSLLNEVAPERCSPGNLTSFTISRHNGQHFSVDLQKLDKNLTEDCHVRGSCYHHGSPTVDTVTGSIIGIFVGGSAKIVFLSKDVLVKLDAMTRNVNKTIDLDLRPAQLQLSSFLKDSAIRQIRIGNYQSNLVD